MKERAMNAIKLIFTLTMYLGASAFASSSSSDHGTATAGAKFLPSQRTLIFSEVHNWQDSDGAVLLCSPSLTWRECTKDSSNKNWVPLARYAFPLAWQVVNLQYVFAGRNGDRILLVVISK